MVLKQELSPLTYTTLREKKANELLREIFHSVYLLGKSDTLNKSACYNGIFPIWILSNFSKDHIIETETGGYKLFWH